MTPSLVMEPSLDTVQMPCLGQYQLLHRRILMGHLRAVNHSTSSGANVGAILNVWAQLPTTGPRTDRDLLITGHWPGVRGRVASGIQGLRGKYL